MIDDTFSFDTSEDDANMVNKFMTMRRQKKNIYFDSYQYVDMLDHLTHKGDLDDASGMADIALDQHPDAPELLMKISELWATLNRGDEALPILDRVTTLEPSNADVYLLRASIYSKMGAYRDAIDDLKKALKHSDVPQDELLINIAFEYQNLRKYDQAVKYLLKAKKKNPSNKDTFFELGFAYERMNSWEDSAMYYRLYIDQDPYCAPAWFNLGYVLAQGEEYEQAIEAYDYALVIQDNFGAALINKGNCLVNLERYQEAIDCYNASLKFENASPQVLCYLGECYEKLEQIDRANNFYMNAITVDPTCAEGWIGLAVVADLNLDGQKALYYTEKAIMLEPENADYWYILSEIHVKSGKVDEAINAFEQIIFLDPEMEDAWLAYSHFHFTQGNYEQAMEVILSGATTLPDSASIAYRIAALLLSMDEESLAIEHLVCALSLDFDAHDELFQYFPISRSNVIVLDLIEKFRSPQ